MIAGNSIVREGSDASSSALDAGFEMPPALTSRYEVRVVDGTDGEQRLGLFRPTDRVVPSIEISNERITARAEDRETIATLVEIAKANGWDRIAVEGSAEFRKAIWTAATREGFAVGGYEPSFADLEQQGRMRGTDAARSAPLSGKPERAPEAGAAALSERAELAELFLHGDAERVAADPRLAAAVRVQSTMEQHIGEVFRDDDRGMASAAIESRRMISDALRRGVDVAVREPTPVRQIEPVPLHPELER